MKTSHPLIRPAFVIFAMAAIGLPAIVILNHDGRSQAPTGDIGTGGGPPPPVPPIPNLGPAPPIPRKKETEPGAGGVKLLTGVAEAVRNGGSLRVAEITNADGSPFRYTGAQLGYKEEVYLELIYLLEARRYWAKVYGADAPATFRERIDLLSAELSLGGTPKLRLGSSHTYVESYVQWYALVAYALLEDPADWKGGSAEKLLDDLTGITQQWSMSSDGRLHFDGSVACAALYATLYLYVNRDLADGAIATAIGTPLRLPEENQDVPDPNRRRVVVLLRAICDKIEGLYPEWKGKTIPETARFRYPHPQDPPEGTDTLAGGKALYFLAKGVLEYETRKKDDKVYNDLVMTRVDRFYGLARQVIWYFVGEQLQRDQNEASGHPLMDSYSFTYIMRAATIYVRTYANAKDGEACKDMVDQISSLLKVTQKPGRGLGFTRSRYYGHLAVLQYLAEWGHIEDMIRKVGEP